MRKRSILSICPIDIIARASQLNHRTVEQVLKGMEQKELIETARAKDLSGDTLHVLDPRRDERSVQHHSRQSGLVALEVAQVEVV